jgi:hypothetical protein
MSLCTREQGIYIMPKTAPASLTVIAILHFVFGGIGVLQDTCAGAMMVAGINQMLVPGSSSPRGTPQFAFIHDMQLAMERIPAYQLAQCVNLGGDLLISMIMIVSGIGLLRLRIWGRFLSILYAILSIAIKVFAVIYTVAFTLPAFNEFLDAHRQSAPEVQMMITMMTIITVVTPVVTVVYMIYPLVVLIIMLLPSTRAAFNEPADVEKAD